MGAEPPIITSTANPGVKTARKLAARKGRLQLGRFLVEGPQAVREGLDQLVELYHTPDVDGHELAATARDLGVDVRLVTPEVLRSLADTVTPQGLVGVAERRHEELDAVADGARFIVVLDGVADPGNAGTIIRTADAAGADAVVLVEGSVDPYGPKAVRASTGSIFHLPVVTDVPVERIAALSGRFTLVAADAHAPRTVDDVELDGPVALVLGGEAAGVSSTLREACSVSVRIPMHAPERPGYRGRAESLNLAAAAAVLAYAVADRQALLRSTSRADHPRSDRAPR